MSNLAAIIEEGENAERAYREAKAFSSAEIGAGDWCHRFYVAHGPALLAVAKAAMERREAEGRMDRLCRESQKDCRCLALGVTCDRCLRVREASEDVEEATTAFDAAVRGEGKEVPRG